MEEIKNPYIRAVAALNSVGADYVIVGGFSLIMHGSNRFTPDINVAVSLEGDNPSKFVKAMLDAGMEPPIGVDVQGYQDPAVRQDWFDNKSMRFLIFGDTELPTFSVQLFNLYPQPMTFEELKNDAVEVDVGGYQACICSKQHLMDMKKIAMRNQDRDDIDALNLIESLGDKLFSSEAINELAAKEEGSFARERLLSLHDFNKMNQTERVDWLKNMLTAMAGFCMI